MNKFSKIALCFLISLFTTTFVLAAGPHSLVAPSTDNDGNFSFSWSYTEYEPDEDIYCLYFEIELILNGNTVEFHDTDDCSPTSYSVTGLTDGTYDIIVRSWEYDEGDESIDRVLTAQTVVSGSSNSGGQASTPEEVTVLSENFENGITWAKSGDYNWIADAYGTGSGGTGPNAAPEGNYYMYLESSWYHAGSAGDTAILTSPSFDNNFTSLSFKYHMYGEDMGTLRVQVYSEGSWETLWEKSGQQHAGQGTSYWEQVDLSLAEYASSISVRFVGVAAGGYRGDMAVDDITISYDAIGGFNEEYEVFRQSGSGANLALTSGNWPSIGDIRLVWNGSSYSVSTVTSTSGWQTAAIDLINDDINLDGAVDLLLKGIDEAVPGVSGIFDQILYAHHDGSTATSITAVDDSFQSFFQDLYGWMMNESYFEDQARTTRQVTTSSASWEAAAPTSLSALLAKARCDSYSGTGSFCVVSFDNPSNCYRYVDFYDEFDNQIGSGYENICLYPYQIWEYSVGSQSIEAFDFSVLNQDALEAAGAMADVFENGEAGVTDAEVEAAESVFSNVLGATLELPLPNISLPTIVVTDTIPIPDTGSDEDVKANLKWIGRFLKLLSTITMAEIVEGLVEANRPVMHYTTATGFLAIETDQAINPPGATIAYFSHLAYPNSDAVMDALSLCGDERIGFYLMNSANISGLSSFSTVESIVCSDGASRGGGGPEATAPVPIPIADARWIPFIQ